MEKHLKGRSDKTAYAAFRTICSKGLRANGGQYQSNQFPEEVILNVIW